MNVVNFVYNDQSIDFEPTGKDDVMVNATQMAKIFGKRIDFFLKADHVKEFISVLEFTPFGVNSTPLKKEEIISTHGKNGTFFHRILALKFAAWLDPKFELWVFITIDKILNEYYRNQRDRLVTRESIKAQLKRKKGEMLESHPEYADIVALEDQLRAIDSQSKVESRKEVRRIQMELIFD